MLTCLSMHVDCHKCKFPTAFKASPVPVSASAVATRRHNASLAMPEIPGTPVARNGDVRSLSRRTSTPLNTSFSPSLTSDDDDSLVSPGSPLGTPLTPIFSGLDAREFHSGSPVGQKRRELCHDSFEFSARGLQLSTNPVGKGTFSRVFKATGPNNQIFAVKESRESVNLDVLNNEVEILIRLNEQGGHPGVVKFYGWYGSSTNRIVLDFYESNLVMHLNQIQSEQSRDTSDFAMFSFQRVSEPLIGKRQWLRWALELTRALEYVHSKGVIHGDLKVDNILRSNTDGRLVVADFSSASIHGSLRLSAFSPVYSAPEVRRGAAASYGSDIYALGLVMLYCGTLVEPYAGAKNPWQRMMWQNTVSPIDCYEPESKQRLRSVLPIIDLMLKRETLSRIIIDLETELDTFA